MLGRKCEFIDNGMLKETVDENLRISAKEFAEQVNISISTVMFTLERKKAWF